MESFYDAAVIWFILGFILFLLEFAVPGLILFFFDVSLNLQLVIFLGSSIITILLFRKSLRNIMWSRKNATEIEDEFIGKTGKAETFIGPGQNGKVDFKGTSWDAKSDDIIEKGGNVTVIGNESILLIVKSTKI